MNFIPTFGSIISTLFTTIFALLQFYPHYGKVIFIFLFMIAVNFILGQILEPRIEGERLGLSPFAILVSLTLWGYIWGFIGMILAVPMTVIIKIFCENIPYLNFVSVILGNKRKAIK
jgi:predicted PurR-regulated permease PerM